MAYATAEDNEFFISNGWKLDDKAMQYWREDGDRHFYVSAVWKHKRPGNLEVPGPDYVFWTAMVTSNKVIYSGYSAPELESHIEAFPVRFVDQQVTPKAAFVLAALRGWEDDYTT